MFVLCFDFSFCSFFGRAFASWILVLHPHLLCSIHVSLIICASEMITCSSSSLSGVTLLQPSGFSFGGLLLLFLTPLVQSSQDSFPPKQTYFINILPCCHSFQCFISWWKTILPCCWPCSCLLSLRGCCCSLPGGCTWGHSVSSTWGAPGRACPQSLPCCLSPALEGSHYFYHMRLGLDV